MRAVKNRILVVLLVFTSLLYITAYAQEIKVDASGAILMDAGSGKCLFEQDAHKRVYPASVTKVMTLLLAMEHLKTGKISLDDQVIISQNASGMGGSQIYMEVGETKTVEQLLKAITVASANDASVALAEHIAGTHELFVQMMNDRARELGMEDTHFVNCHGLHDENHYTSAYDVAIMSRELVKHKKIFDWTTIWMEDIEVGRDGRFKTIGMTNTNKLIRRYDGADGLKTGSHSNSKYCLSATAIRGNLRLIAVIMGAPTSEVRFNDATKLLNYGYARYNSVPIAKKTDIINQVRVSKGLEKEIDIRPADDVNILVQKGQENSLEREVVLPEYVKAPIMEGQKVGELIIKQDGEIVDRVDLVSNSTVEKAGLFQMLRRIVMDWILADKKN
jgi:D-alanyl-D-alanine carboxypeptidase (penicillin-binding protein 5/6)